MDDSMRNSGVRSFGLGLSLVVLGACQAHDPSVETKAAAPPASSGPAESAAESAPKPPSLRLDPATRPVSYDVALTVVPTQDRFDGRIAIAVELRDPSKVVWLNATGLEVRAVTVNGAPAKVVPGGEDFIGIQSREPISGKATLVLEYSGEISRKNMSGLFQQKEGEHWYAITDFEPNDARRVFPCFDEPSFKVPWKVQVKTKREHVAFSNTPQVSEKIEGDFKIIQFAETKPLPSYLIALGVGPFDVVDAGTGGKNKTPVRIIVPRGRGVEARVAKEVSARVLGELEAYFGIPYPYEKLDAINVPLAGNGAMENPGLVTFNQKLLLARPDQETARFRRAYTHVATHEFAHQWFGDLVTTAWWDDIWLNEAFATWMTSFVIEKWKPEWRESSDRILSAARAMRTDSLVSTRKIRQPIASNHDIRNAFDDITYQKGAAVIRMFEKWVGPETFRAGVQRYLTQYAHRAATADQFLAAVFQGEQAKTIEAFGTFLNQAGVPLVGAQLRCDQGAPPKLVLSQERYLPLGSEGSTEQKWQIPVCASYPGKKAPARACTLLTETRGELALPEAASCPAWVNANADAHGYYRVHHQGDLLGKLVANAKVLSTPEKVALLSDVLALVQAGKVAYADALAIVPKLANDPDRAVVAMTLDLVAGLRDSEMFPESQRPKYARFLRDVYGARAGKLGFAVRASDDDETRFLRQSIVSLVADQGEERALQMEAKKLAVRWLDEHKGDPDSLDAVLSVAARTGDRALFDRMLAAAKKATDRRERTQLLQAAAQFRDPEIARVTLPLSLGDEFDARESVGFIWGALGAPATRSLAYDFVKQNYDALAARLPRDSLSGLARIGSAFCDDAHRTDVEAFFRDRAARTAGGPRVLAQTLETIKVCSTIRATQSPSVAAFLQKR